MAKVNQVLIDKLFPLAAQEHNGKMYVTPMDEHYLCNVLDGAELGRDGQVYVNRACCLRRLGALQTLHGIQGQPCGGEGHRRDDVGTVCILVQCTHRTCFQKM